MLSNKEIVARIRQIAKSKGIKNDAEIARRAGATRVMLIDLPLLKTSPRLDTIEKFAIGLGVSVSELIYKTPQTEQSEISRIYSELTPTEQNELLAIASGMILRRKYENPDKKGTGVKRRKVA